MPTDWPTVDTRTACALYSKLYYNIHTDDLAFAKIQRLQEESDDIRWQVVSRQATLTFSDSAAQRLLDIQVQIGQVRELSSALFVSVCWRAVY